MRVDIPTTHPRKLHRIMDGERPANSPTQTPPSSGVPERGGLPTSPGAVDVFGGWFAVWTNRHEPHLPEHQRTEVVRARGEPGGDILAGNYVGGT